MIYTFGDSHAAHSFRNIKEVITGPMTGITMHRVGRDGMIAKYCIHQNIKPHDTLIWCFGEIDVRCHIKKQEDLGREIDEIISELVEKYILTIIKNIEKTPCLMYIMSIVPPIDKDKVIENKDFPFIGTNQERANFTLKINQLLKKKCAEHNIKYFDIHSDYVDENGMLKFELSDKNVHIRDSSLVYEKMKNIGIIK